MAVVALMTAVLFAASLGVGVATAPASKGVANVFGERGSGDGEFQFPEDIAANEATGDIYVADRSNHRVQIFESNGEYKAEFGSQGDAEGEFASLTGIAIDQDTGDVFVHDRSNRRIQKFDAGGNFERTWGWGVQDGSSEFQICTSGCEAGIAGSGAGQLGSGNDVLRLDVSPPDGDPGTGSVYVADSGNNRVQEFDLDGNPLGAWGDAGDGTGEFSSSQPLHVAVDGAGIVYMSDGNDSNRIQRYDTGADAFLDPITTTNVPELPGDVTMGLEVDPDAERLFVNLRDGFHVHDGIHELDISVHPPIHVDVHATHIGTVTVGLGLNASAGTLFVAQARTTSAEHNRFNHRVYIIDDVDTPTVTLTDVSPTPFTAVLEGEVNPNNSFAAYHFEVSDDDGATWRQVPPDDDVFDDVAIGGGTDPIPVSEEITNLQPGTEHLTRLVGWQYWGPSSEVSPVVAFETPAVPPEILVTASRALGPTEASLRGRVLPHNFDTDYHFEWGTDQSYGETTPVTNIGAGSDVVHVANTIAGLEPGTTYHFRLVAENEGGLTEGPDRTFTTPDGPPPPLGERAYELVTTMEKHGGEPQVSLTHLGNSSGATTLGVAQDGSAVSWFSTSIFHPDNDGGTAYPQYVSHRGEQAWWTVGISPTSHVHGQGTPPFPFIDTFSEDLSRAIVRVRFAHLTPEAEDLLDEGVGLYVRDTRTEVYTLVAPPHQPLSGTGSHAVFQDATPGLEHIVVNSERELLPESPPDGTSAVYEWSGGEPRLVSILPDDACVEPPCIPAGHASAGHMDARINDPGSNVISRDGSRIYFTVGSPSTGGNKPLYLRQNGTSTTLVSASERTGDDPDEPRGAQFRFATPDGSKAFFHSSQRLTDDASATSGRSDLYLWDGDAPAGFRLTNLTPEAIVQDDDGGGTFGHVAGADDGSHIYFMAEGVLDYGAVSGENNLYVWKRGEGVRLISTLAAGNTDQAVWTMSRAAGVRYKDARVSEDGRRLLFASRAKLTTHDNDGTRQIYLYDVGADELTCVSCSSLVEPSAHDATLLKPGGTGSQIMPRVLPRNLSDDGSRVFFETEESLVPEDTNGVVDVYEWRDGELGLVSDGSSAHESRFIGASADGEDVFFITRANLSGWDQDGLGDVYRATTGETFPEPEPAPEPCVGDECQGPAMDAPPTLNLGSSELRAPEAERPSECAALVQRARRHLALARRAALLARRQMAVARRAIARRPATNRARQARRQARQARRQAQRSRTQAQRSIRAARNCLRGER